MADHPAGGPGFRLGEAGLGSLPDYRHAKVSNQSGPRPGDPRSNSRKKQLRNLDAVQGGPFADIVRDDPEAKAVFC